MGHRMGDIAGSEDIVAAALVAFAGWVDIAMGTVSVALATTLFVACRDV